MLEWIVECNLCIIFFTATYAFQSIGYQLAKVDKCHPSYLKASFIDGKVY